MRQIDLEIGYILDRVAGKLKEREYDVYLVLRYERGPLDSISSLSKKAHMPRTTFISRMQRMENSLRRLILEAFDEAYIQDVNRRFFGDSEDG